MDCVIYDREGFSNRQRELLEKIKPLGRYFSKETIDYLNSLVNLDECILKDDAFFNEFGSMDLVYDLMKFNLIGRIYRTIDNDKRLTQDSVKSNNSIDDLYDRGIKAGALGGKLLGAGGGGFLLFYVEKDKQESVLKALDDLMHVPFQFESEGSTVIHYNPIVYIPRKEIKID